MDPILPQSYYIESNNENIGLVKIGITGMSDDLTLDKVVVLSPEIKMGYVKPISQLNRYTESAMAALLIIKADRRLSHRYDILFK